MKQIRYYSINAADTPQQVPRGIPVEFGPGAGPFDTWWEVFVPGHDFDDTYEPEKQWVAVVATFTKVPDGWQWLRSCQSEGVAWHLYRVPDREMEGKRG